jgi:hypothetical protein
MVSVADGVSATLVQISVFRSATQPVPNKTGDLWIDISGPTPVYKYCSSLSPITFLSLDTGGGGGGSVNSGTAEIDFGTFPGTNEASVAVTGQTAILSTSKIKAFVMADDITTGTGAHTASDHRYFAMLVGLTCSTPTAGVGFTIYGRCSEKLTGKFAVRFLWTD